MMRVALVAHRTRLPEWALTVSVRPRAWVAGSQMLLRSWLSVQPFDKSKLFAAAIGLLIVNAVLQNINYQDAAVAARFDRIIQLEHGLQGAPTFDAKSKVFADKVAQGLGVAHPTAEEFSGWILEASERQHLQPELIASLVFAESSFRKHVRSHVGAVGPAQVRPNYWSNFCGRSDLHDPEQNIYCGAQVLRHFLERCEDNYSCALAGYNVGLHSNREAAGLRYVAKIDRTMARLSETL